MDTVVARTVALLAVAIVVAIAARRLLLPYTVGLVIAGIGLAFAKVGLSFALTHDIIFDLILPPLLFEAALNIHWRELRRDLLPILTLSMCGVLISALTAAVGMNWLLDWPFASALLFGALIAATDPVAVIAMFKDTGVGGRLRLLVESESLFNDGIAAVLFGLALIWAQANGAAGHSAVFVAREVALTSIGGIAIGLLVGGISILIAWRTSDHLVETAVTTVAAYGSFLIAEHFRCSGVLACVCAGLAVGNLGICGTGQQILSDDATAFVGAFWEFAAFVANSFVFLLIGSTVAGIPFEDIGVRPLAAAIALVLLGRALSVYPLCLPFVWSKWSIPLADQHVLWWGGLRGALALALALAIPPSILFHREIQIVTFGVVAFSVVVQGLTMPALLRSLGFSAAKRAPHA